MAHLNSTDLSVSLFLLIPPSITSLVWASSFQLREEIDKYGIKIYQFPDCDSDEDEEFKKQDKELKVISVPEIVHLLVCTVWYQSNL